MSVIDDLLDRWEEQRELGVNLSAEELCIDHPELLEEVERQITALLAFESGFGFDLKEKSTAGLLAGSLYSPPQDLQLINRYSLQGCHAVGGLGQVYLAHDQVLNRRVAIKFPRLQGMSNQQIARFELEARITGQLDHPGIVPIHALDTTTAGEPCYVMRFVDGMTLQKAVENRLANCGEHANAAYFTGDELRYFLQSFVTVCNIVAFAHGRNIVHRDIKPSNILLGPYGETLLLDWGIAKELNIESAAVNERKVDSASASTDVSSPDCLPTNSPLLTMPGRVLGTPAYASPEQLLGRSDGIGKPSDIYSLGATLFFLLDGKSPIELVGWSTYLELVKRSDTTLTRYLSSSVPTPLRAICEKALSIEPERRYASPLDLAADIDRYLAGESVSVMRDPWWIRLTRTARKHPLVTGATIASTIVLSIAGIVASTVVSNKNRELAKGNQQLAVALGNVGLANELAMRALRDMASDVVVRRFAENENLKDSERAYIESILQNFLALSNLQDNTETTLSLRAESHAMVGKLYYQLAQKQESQKHLTTAAELFTSLVRIQNRDESRLRLASVFEELAAVDFEASRFSSCIETSTKGIDVLAPLLTRTSDEELRALESVMGNLRIIRAEAFQSVGRRKEAVAEFAQAVPILERRLLASPNDIGSRFNAGASFRSFASLLNEEIGPGADRSSALEYANRAVELLRQAAAESPDTARYQSSLAWAYYDRSFLYQSDGKFEETLSDITKSLELTTAIANRYPLIRDYRDRIAICILRRAKLFQQMNKPDEAQRDLQQATDQLRNLIASTKNSLINPKDFSVWMLDIAELYIAIGQREPASRVLYEATTLLDKTTEIDEVVMKELRIRLARVRDQLNANGD